MLDGPALFARHLDLEPLKGRRTGRVRCIFHAERTASLSIDLDAGVFHCFGCGEQGGVKAFAVKVGEQAETTPHLSREPTWEAMLRLVSQQRGGQPHVRDLYALSDWIRVTRRAVAHARSTPRELDTDWDALAAASTLESLANWAEQELDAIYALGPIA
jgi:hypothetical protein